MGSFYFSFLAIFLNGARLPFRMVNIPSVKYVPVSDKISVHLLNGGLDLVQIVKDHSALLLPLTGENRIYLGVFYDLKRDPNTPVDPTKSYTSNGRYNLPLTVHSGEDGLQLLVTDADVDGIKEFLKERAELEKRIEGVTRPYGPYVNAIFYQAE